MLKIGLKRISAILILSLLGWLACSALSMAEESLPLAKGDANTQKSDGLSTDLLETDPVKEPAKIPTSLDLEAISADIPEEILRTEIITGARSPLTGEPLTAAEYAQLQEALDNPVASYQVSADIRYLVFLLQLRRAVRPILPFIR